MGYDREYIEETFQHPVRRERLKYVLGCKTDRQARMVLSRLQEEYNIINMQDGTGYKLGTDEEVKQYANQEMNRARKVFIKAGGMLKRCTLTDGIQIPVRAHFRKIKARTELKDQISLEDIL